MLESVADTRRDDSRINCETTNYFAYSGTEAKAG
jgi:hypothetical protein